MGQKDKKKTKEVVEAKNDDSKPRASRRGAAAESTPSTEVPKKETEAERRLRHEKRNALEREQRKTESEEARRKRREARNAADRKRRAMENELARKERRARRNLTERHHRTEETEEQKRERRKRRNEADRERRAKETAEQRQERINKRRNARGAGFAGTKPMPAPASPTNSNTPADGSTVAPADGTVAAALAPDDTVAAV